MSVGAKKLGWSYLCRRHFYWALLRGDSISFCKPNEEGEVASKYHCDWNGKCKRKAYKEVYVGFKELLESCGSTEYKPLEEVEKEIDNEES